MAVAMAVLDARIRVEGPGGVRTLAARELHRLPGDRPERDTVLEPGELITAIELPPPLPRAHSAYRKVRDRASFAFALVSAAVVAEVGDGVVEDCRIALGSVAHVPWRALRAEETLRGRPADENSFTRAAEVELAQARPLRDNAYKVALARNLLVRTLKEVASR
jgi:xanthine dehydrogenase YagS FAD-binding subunit